MPAQSAPVRMWHYSADGDNYPVTRTHHTGEIAEYTHPWLTESPAVYWIDPGTIPHAHRNVYLIDIAGTVRAYYVAGWSGATDAPAGILLYPMSAQDRQSGYRWRIGPRRAYHLILDPLDSVPTGHPSYVPTAERPATRHPLSDLGTH